MFQHGDATIHYEVTGQGVPLLFLPGVTESISQYAEWLAPLARSHRIIAADLPGSGRSGPQPRTYHVGYYQDDAASFAALLVHLGVSRAHLMGFSDGGEVALQMASATPDRARSVLTWGSSGFARDPDGRIAAIFRNLFDDPVAETAEWRARLVERHGANLARIITRNFADGIDALVAAGGDICRSRAHLIACPVCLIAGQDDPFVPADLLQTLSDRIASVETHLVAGTGHGVHQDRPDWLLATATDWLSRH